MYLTGALNWDYSISASAKSGVGCENLFGAAESRKLDSLTAIFSSGVPSVMVGLTGKSKDLPVLHRILTLVTACRHSVRRMVAEIKTVYGAHIMNTSDQRALAPVIFQFHSTDIRTVVADNSEPWFCAKDVCEILGYANDSKAIKDHCREAGVTKRYLGVTTGKKTDGSEATQTVSMTFINEGNLYRLIIKSRKPEAEEFEIKLMEEILPTIRKTGKYEAKPKRAYRTNKYYYPRRLLEQYGFTTENRAAKLSALMLSSDSFTSPLHALLNDLHTNGNDISAAIDEYIITT